MLNTEKKGIAFSWIWLLYLSILAALLLRAWFIWVVTDTAWLVIEDDAFYGFGLARNIAQGNGATFDGVVHTSGFQPLLVYSMVPIYMLIQDAVLPIKIVLTLSGIYTALTALLIWSIIKKLTGKDMAAFVPAFIWILSPIVFRNEIAGTETSLSVLIISLVVWYLVSLGGNYTAKNLIALGALIGVAIYARLDNVFLLLAVSAWLLPRIRLKVSYVLIPAGLLLLPWVAWDYFSFGLIVPESGRAAMANIRFVREELLGITGLGSNLVVSFLSSLYELGSYTFPMPVSLVRYLLGHKFVALLLTGLTAMAVLAGFYLLSRRYRRQIDWVSIRRNIGSIFPLIPFSVAIFLFYVLVIWLLFPRYLAPPFLTLTLLLGIVLGSLSLKRKHLYIPVVVFCSAFIILMAAMLSQVGSQARVGLIATRADNIVAWLEKHTSPDELVGAFNAGRVGYLSERTVINLDGRVNGKAYQAAFVDKDIIHYLRQEGIVYLIDYKRLIYNMVNGTRDLELVATLGETQPGLMSSDSYVVYRVLQEQKIPFPPLSGTDATRR